MTEDQATELIKVLTYGVGTLWWIAFWMALHTLFGGSK